MKLGDKVLVRWEYAPDGRISDIEGKSDNSGQMVYITPLTKFYSFQPFWTDRDNLHKTYLSGDNWTI